MVNLSQALQSLLVDALQFIPNLVVALITFVLTLLLAGPAARAMRRALALRIDEEGLLNLLTRFTRWSVIVIGVIIALQQVNFNVTGFLTGLGVVGLTIGFALQDIARNFVAGIILMIRQPFCVGDGVTVAGFSGTVLAVNPRDTVVKTWDGEMVVVPNINVFQNPISNFSRSQLRMRTIQIGLGYGQDAQSALALFLLTVESVPGVLDSPAPSVWADGLGNSTINLSARFWVDTKATNLFEVHSNVVLALNTAAEKAGIELPYPIQTVRLEQSQRAQA